MNGLAASARPTAATGTQGLESQPATPRAEVTGAAAAISWLPGMERVAPELARERWCSEEADSGEEEITRAGGVHRVVCLTDGISHNYHNPSTPFLTFFMRSNRATRSRLASLSLKLL
jgi:hypothetical protein